jgi:putative tricarboxylic transport membrane protein
MRVSNFAPGLMILALSVAVFVESRDLPYWSDTTPGPGFFPRLIVITGVVLFLLQFAEAWRTAGQQVAEWPDRTGLERAGMTYAGLAGLAILAPMLGMLPSIALFLLFLLIVVLRQSVQSSLIAAGITLGVIYLVFVRWLGIALPTGPLGI